MPIGRFESQHTEGKVYEDQFVRLGTEMIVNER